MAVWINEFHYDNAGTDTGEFIEVAGLAGTDLSGWSLVLYNGNPTQRIAYATIDLGGVIADQQNGFGAVSFSIAGLQNGNASGTEPDGIALANGSTLVQFLSYEGSFTALDGVAAGETSTDIGLFQSGGEPVGASLALVGSGTAYGDFAWTATTDDSPGAVNAGQSFTVPGATSVGISNASVAEGDDGTATLTFTVTRSDTAGAFTVDFATADGTASAGSDYVAAAGTLSFAAGGAASQTISVTVTGDTAAEPDETLLVSLSNLASTSGSAVLGTAQGTGTIVNDDVILTKIGAIQGAGHKAPSVGGDVASSGNSGATRFNVEGVVTAIAANGFWIQDPEGDGDDATSDGIFVFTSSAPAATIEVGETVRLLDVQVNEFRLGSAGNNLTVTQLSAGTGTLVELGGSTAVAPVVIGADRTPPTGAIEDDGFASFDPDSDAIDFWESLEGMLVELPDPIAISPTAEFRTRDPNDPSNAEGPPNEEIWVLVPGAFDAASLSSGGAPLLGPTDANPERIQLDDLTPAVDLPSVSVGAQLSTVTGVVGYDFQNYEILVPTAPGVAAPSPLVPEVTALERDARQLTIAAYNVENLDPKLESTEAGAVSGSDLYARLGNSDDDVGSGKYARHAEQIAVNLGAPAIVALQEVQDDDGAEISDVVASDLALQTLVDLIAANHGVTYAFAYESPGNNEDGGQPNANIRNAFLYRPDIVTLAGTSRLTDPDPMAADDFAGDDFAESRKPLVGEFLFNGVTLTVVNNHFNSKGGDNALFGNVQPPVLGSEPQRIEQARLVHDFVQQKLAMDAGARVMVLGDLNDFAWSAPLQALSGAAEGSEILFNLQEEKLPPAERYTYNFQGNAQSLDHAYVTGAVLGATAGFDIVHMNSDFADQASDHDPGLALVDFRGFDEVLRLTDAAETVDGAGGDDTVFGRGGDDTIEGGAGEDLLAGGAGDDLYRLSDALDIVIEGAGLGADTVTGAVSLTLRPHVEAGVLEGGEALDLRGNAGDNLLIGNAGANLLAGFGGSDTQEGGAGDDRLRGGDGDDLLRGGLGADLVLGGAGADTVEGGAARDRLAGGAEADLFLLEQVPADFVEADIILDFAAGEDAIGILGAAFDPSLAPGALDPSRFVANTSGQATMAGLGAFAFDTDDGRLWWDADGAGGAQRDLVAILRGGATLGAGDLVIV